MIKIPKTVNVCEDKYVCWGHTEFGNETEECLFKLLNTDFEVTLNHIPCEVRECRVSAIPFNRPWPGKQRPLDQTESAGYITFSADEAVELRVKRKKKFDSAIIRPLSKNVEVTVAEDQAVFTLRECGQYVLEFGDTHNVLHIFFEKIKEYPDAKNATVYFGPGIHFPGVISLRDNDSVYIDRQAVVFGSLYSAGAKNVKIFGGGVLDNSTEERITEHCYENHTKGTFRIYNCENVDVSDIILTNSSTWALSMFNCRNIHVNNVKLVGHWRYNTDGIDIVNSEDVSVENCFIRSFDDTISIKAIYDHPKPVQNITVDRCVMWCGWGKNCEIGIETACTEYKNVTFKNCDLIHNSHGAMCISCGNQADMHHLLFENIHVEFQSEGLPQVLQQEDGQKYDPCGKTLLPRMIRNSLKAFAIRTECATGILRKTSEKPGDIHDITYRNITVHTDDPKIKPVIDMEALVGEKKIRNFHLENVFINGKKVDCLEAFDLRLVNTENVTIT